MCHKNVVCACLTSTVLLACVKQYAALQQRYYSLEIQLRQLQKSQPQQDQGAGDPQRQHDQQQQQDEQLSSPRKVGLHTAQKQLEQKQAALMKLRGKRSQAKGLGFNHNKQPHGMAAAAGEVAAGAGANNGDEGQTREMGYDQSDVSSSREDVWDNEGVDEEGWEAVGGGEAVAMWQQRCRTLQEANRQLRQQLLKLANGAVEGIGQEQVGKWVRVKG